MTESNSLLPGLLCKRFPILANLNDGSAPQAPSQEEMLEVECYRRILEELSPGELKEYEGLHPLELLALENADRLKLR